MSLSCGFFNSENGDRQYFNQDLTNFLEGLVEDGVYGFIDDHMVVKASSTPDMRVWVGKGRAWFNGTWTKIDSAVEVTIPASDAVLNRIDAICLTVNLTRAVRNNYIEVISGTGASGTPAKPTIPEEAGIFRHVLAYVTVGKGVSSINTANIEVVVGTSECPFSKPNWEHNPPSDLYVAQWQAQFDQFMDHIHETFDQDAAGHLQTQIDTSKSNFAPELDPELEPSVGSYYINEDGQLVRGALRGRLVQTTVGQELQDFYTTLENMRTDFQDGVDTIYNGLTTRGMSPSASTPEALSYAVGEGLGSLYDYAWGYGHDSGVGHDDATIDEVKSAIDTIAEFTWKETITVSTGSSTYAWATLPAHNLISLKVTEMTATYANASVTGTAQTQYTLSNGYNIPIPSNVREVRINVQSNGSVKLEATYQAIKSEW